jgi:uracil phosphoribosyltransferase
VPDATVPQVIVPQVTVLDDDPIAGVQLASLRDGSTTPEHFRHHARRLGSILALRAVQGLPGAAGEVASPLGPAPTFGPARTIVAVPVLRAGLGLLGGVHDVLPSALVGMIGLERDAESLQARRYYFKVPPLDGAWVLVLEPMLATGGSASDAVKALDAEGAEQVLVLSVVATQYGIDRILTENPGVRIVTAAIDPELNDHGYIVPGLGDFGDRLFGTPH